MLKCQVILRLPSPCRKLFPRPTPTCGRQGLTTSAHLLHSRRHRRAAPQNTVMLPSPLTPMWHSGQQPGRQVLEQQHDQRKKKG